MIPKASVLKGLKTRVIGKKLFVFESIDSTNACAKTLAETGTPEGTVIVADHQSAGRGRLGRTWVSEPGANLLFSVVLRPTLQKESAALLTFFSAVFIARAVEKVSKLPVECKWPNDILVHGRKCCGILLENSFQQERLAFSIVGIGINVNQETFPDDLNDRATSLFRECGKKYDRVEVLRTLLQEADGLLPVIQKGSAHKIMEEWNAHCSMFGKPVTVSYGENIVSGTALHLDPEGGLVIKTPEGTSTFYAGDVTVVN
ncbi:MAG TPA: biotin--[acetyl-CoA-carboxylase] ligase [Bacteroidota bacterium]